jgi:hypothetical protein
MLIVQFHNTGKGNEKVSNYDVAAYINETRIWFGKIEQHYRGDFRDLIIDLAHQFETEQHKEEMNL